MEDTFVHCCVSLAGKIDRNMPLACIDLDRRRLRYAFSHIPMFVGGEGETMHYKEEVENDPSFTNPSALEDMITSFHVAMDDCTLIRPITK